MKIGGTGLGAITVMLVTASATAAGTGDATRGAKVFQACAACHSFEPARHMTGPSLSGFWGRKAGSVQDFIRYSDALKKSGVVWNEHSLDQWLENPAAFIPGNQMLFQGLDNAKVRQDLIAYLKLASEGRAPSGSESQAGGMMGGQSRGHNLKQLEAAYRVKEIRYCRDSYFVSTEDGGMHPFWEPNLRFKTDSSDIGPTPGHPVMLPAGMMGDRASVFFSSPEEISPFIKKRC